MCHSKKETQVKNRNSETNKKSVIKKWYSSENEKYWMTEKEFTSIVVGKESTNSEYVITDGIIEPNGFVPDHYHKWEDQTFHVIEGKLEAKIGNETFVIQSGDSIHCPRGISHYMKNIGNKNAKLISYIIPEDWAKDFMAETSKQVKSGKLDLKLMEEKYGVIYI